VVSNTTTIRVNGASVNTVINSTKVFLGNSTSNSTLTQISLGVANATHNTNITPNSINTGNATSNSVLSQSLVLVSNSTSNTIITPATITVGNSTINLAVSQNTISGAFRAVNAVAMSNTLIVTGTATLSNTLIVTGTATFNGDAILGDATSDTIIVTSRIGSNVDPLSNTLSFGSTTRRWNVNSNNINSSGTLLATGAATLSNTLAVTGATTLSNTLIVTGDATFNGDTILGDTVTDTITVTSRIGSNVDPVSNTLNFGSTTRRWNVNSNNINSSGTLAVTGATTLSNTLAVTGATTLSNTLIVTGDATFNGDTILGDATSDTITVAARIGSNVDPVSNTLNFGSTTRRWNVNSNNINSSGTLAVTGAATLSNTLNVTGFANVQSTLQVGTNLTVGANASIGETVLIKNDYLIQVESNTDVGITTGSEVLVYRFPKSVYSSGKFEVQIKNTGNTQISEFVLAHDTTSAYITVYGTIASPAAANGSISPLGNFSANVNGANVDVLLTQTNPNSAVKIVAHLIK